jgi:hypothetical protein
LENLKSKLRPWEKVKKWNRWAKILTAVLPQKSQTQLSCHDPNTVDVADVISRLMVKELMKMSCHS